MTSPHDHDHDRMRSLLEDTVCDVEPSHGLDAIRARTARQPRRRSWPLAAGGAAAAVAATVAVVVSTGALPGPGGSGGPASQSSPEPQPSATDGPTSSADRPLRVFYVADSGLGPRLYAEQVSSDDPATELTGTLEMALAGDADDPDYGSPWPDGTALAHAGVEADELVVDLTGPVAERPAGMTEPEAAMALQQLVFTAQGAAGTRTPVTFLVDGQPAGTVLGEQVPRQLDALPADDALAPVSISSPHDGEVLPGRFTVEGEAATFEANVQWELRRGAEVVRSGFATAQECCTLSPYAFEVEAPPGDYTLVVLEEDVSDGEGNPPSQDTKQVTVE